MSGSQKEGKLQNIIVQNVILANQKLIPYRSIKKDPCTMLIPYRSIKKDPCTMLIPYRSIKKDPCTMLIPYTGCQLHLYEKVGKK